MHIADHTISTRTRIAVFEENKNVLAHIASLLSSEPLLELTGEFHDVNNYPGKLQAARPHIVIMDIKMLEIDGILMIKEIKNQFPDVHILVQTSTEDDLTILAAVHAGISGYIGKGCLGPYLITAIKELLAGGSPLSPWVARKIMNMVFQSIGSSNKPAGYKLTSREKTILSCIVSGASYKMISEELNISYDTVRSHIKRIYKKLDVKSLTGAVSKALNEQIV